MEEAKRHLHITDNDADFDIEDKLEEASDIVLDYAKLESVPAEWFTGSPLQLVPPRRYRAATKLILSSLYWNRESEISEALSDAVKALIGRDPTLA